MEKKKAKKKKKNKKEKKATDVDDEADKIYGPHESKIKQAYSKDIERKLK